MTKNYNYYLVNADISRFAKSRRESISVPDFARVSCSAERH